MDRVTQPPGRSKADERRRSVISGAAALFDAAGYYHTSVEDIAGVVGLRKPTLYHYFKSKDEILYWIHEEFIDLLISRQRAREATNLSPEQQLLEIMGDILELMETHRGHVRVFFEHHRELPVDSRATISRKRDEYEALVEEEVRRGIAAGAFRDIDVRLATLALFGMTNWAYQWFRAEGSLRAREIAYVFWDIFLHGIARTD
jgi:AcrR family transcriptional regulator